MSNEQRIADCRRLYEKYEGKQHEQIEREMRELGHTRFRRRILYKRRERGRDVPGWIERYEWKAEPPASAGGSRLRYERAKGSRRMFRAAMPPAHAGGSALLPRRNRQKQRRLRKLALRRAALPPDERKGSALPASSIIPFRGYASIGGIAPEKLADHHGKAEPFRSSGGEAANALASSTSPLPTSSTGFADWLTYVSPYMKWNAAHHRHIIDTLERVTSGECKRLMIFMPPRHGKSELVTVRYAAWRMRQKPETNIIIGSYNQRLANRFSRKIKTVLCDDMATGAAKTGAASILACHVAEGGVENSQSHSTSGERLNGSSNRGKQGCSPLQSNDTSPFPFARPRFKNSESEWETRLGGGLRAVGVGSGVTGFGANLLIVDDPVKSRAEAESIKYRERVWAWFNDDLYTRLEPDGQIILIQTRWHEDDLAGRLLAENADEWTIIDLPALAEASATGEASIPACRTGEASISACHAAAGGGARAHDHAGDGPADRGKQGCLPLQSGEQGCSPLQSVDAIGRGVGDALWPARFDEKHLESTKQKIGAYSFASLYQQHPVPAEGGMFKKDWFTHIFDRPPHGLIWKRGYDLAITANPTSDYTASFRVAYDKEGNLWIDGGFRKRIEYPEQRRYVLGRIREETDTEHGIEQSANGTPVYQEIRKEVRLQGRAFRAIQVKGDKATRAAAWLNLASEGKLRLVRAAWNKEFIDECCAFPLGTHDDQVDAVSIAVAMHTRNKNGFYTF